MPFSSSTSCTTAPFELIHCDVWGPYKTSTADGCKYFLTVVDDNSRAIWTILLLTKHVTKSLQDFYVYVSNQFKTSIKCIRSDNGGEFVNAELSSFLIDHGVIHQTTCPYTPNKMGELKGDTEHY